MNKICLLLLIFLIMSLSFIVTGCSLLPETSLAIVDYHLEKSADEGAQIVGTARNDGTAKLEYAEVKGNFYDKDSTLLYSGVATATDLDIGKIWDFTIPYSTEKEAHSSLNILSCSLEKDSSAAKAVGEVENDGDVTLSSAKITATFYDADRETLGTGTTSIIDLEVGEIREYTILYPGSNYEEVDYVTTKASELTTTDYPAVEEVDHITAQVGRLIGRTVMP